MREKIISIHVPKCAGTSLKSALREALGSALMLDYGDRLLDVSQRGVRIRLRRKALLLKEHEEYAECIMVHGHFYATKYLDVYPGARYVTIIRNPRDLVLSYFYYLLRLPAGRPIADFAKSLGGLEQFIVHPWFNNIISKQLWPLRPADFSLIATLEKYQEYIAALGSMLGATPAHIVRNSNPEGSGYAEHANLDALISEHNADDFSLYREITAGGGILFRNA